MCVGDTEHHLTVQSQNAFLNKPALKHPSPCYVQYVCSRDQNLKQRLAPTASRNARPSDGWERNDELAKTLANNQQTNRTNKTKQTKQYD